MNLASDGIGEVIGVYSTHGHKFNRVEYNIKYRGNDTLYTHIRWESAWMVMIGDEVLLQAGQIINDTYLNAILYRLQRRPEWWMNRTETMVKI
ncbi:MAG: hypothetical protein NTV33_10905 [Coprothermobacterota bacterium]|nr:hypothetical protein [Coprothermobacterota bacterium]